MATISKRPLIVITGPTGSGKSALALRLAEHHQGEIVCADSRTVYKGMDIGTAKPTEEEQARVPHHLLDVVEPGERFTVHDFQRLARQAIADIYQRGKIPLIVGGTGLYIDSVVLDYQFVPTNKDERRALSDKTVEELQMMIKNQHLIMPENHMNKRHLMQAIHSKGIKSSSLPIPQENNIVVAIATNKNELENRLRRRAMQIFASGVIDEAKILGEKYGWNSEAMTGNIYPIIKRHIDNEISIEEAIDIFVIRDRQLAKRQITWLKRHDFVKWLSLEDAHDFLNQTLIQYRGR